MKIWRKVLFVPAAAVFFIRFLVLKIITPPKRPNYKQDKIIEVRPEEVVLRLTPGTVRPGIYELNFPGGMALVGEVVEMYDDTVCRRLLEVSSGKLKIGAADFGRVYGGNPRTRLGVDYLDVDLKIGVGDIPAWVITAGDGATQSDAWAVLVHGWGQERAYCLQYVPLLTSLGINCIIPSYRNDLDAPKSPDGKYGLGLVEWQEAEAAMDYAVANGAKDIILYGFSMGGEIVMQAAIRSELKSRVAAVILDGPVLDWERTLFYQGSQYHLPRFVSLLTMKMLEITKGIRLKDLNLIDNNIAVSCPILILHARDDAVVPFSASRLFSEKYANVTLCNFKEGGHMLLLNSNRERYESEVREFLQKALYAKDTPVALS